MHGFSKEYFGLLVLLIAGCGVNGDGDTIAESAGNADTRREAADREQVVTEALENAGYILKYDFLESPSSQPTPEIQRLVDAYGANYVGDPVYIGNAGKLTHLHLLRKLPSLHTADLAESNATDDDLKHLSNLPNLHTVFLTRTRIRGPGLQYLAGTPIHSLHLKEVRLDSSGIDNLCKLTSLKNLFIYDGDGVTANDSERLKAALPLCNIPYLTQVSI